MAHNQFTRFTKFLKAHSPDWDTIGTVFGLILTVLVIIAVIAETIYCFPFWFDTILNVPAICLMHR